MGDCLRARRLILHLLGLALYIVEPRSHLVQRENKLCCFSGISVRCSCAHGIAGGQVPPEPTPFVNSARGVRRFGFWGAFARLPASTTATPDCLLRLLCYDDDNTMSESSPSNAAGNVGQFSVTGFAAVLKPNAFDGKNFMTWRAKMELWLTAMNCYHVAEGKPDNLAADEESKFRAADNLFRGAVICALHTKYEKNYISCTSGKELWDALNDKFGVSDAGSELYLMEKLYEYKMVENRSIVEQTHEIQALAKELEHFPCVLPDKFVAGGIIAKLPPSWKDFATSLKHKRQEFNVADLIGTLDVEERARGKDNRGKDPESSAANMVQKKNFHASRNFKKKNKGKQDHNPKPKQTTEFKKKNNKKRNEGCFVCGSDEHWAGGCPDRKFFKEKKSANMVTNETGGGTSGSAGLEPCRWGTVRVRMFMVLVPSF